jgi:hypothetical protein
MAGSGYYFPTFPAIELDEIKKIEEEEKLGDTITEIETEESLNDLRRYFEDLKEEFR